LYGGCGTYGAYGCDTCEQPKKKHRLFSHKKETGCDDCNTCAAPAVTYQPAPACNTCAAPASYGCDTCEAERKGLCARLKARLHKSKDTCDTCDTCGGTWSSSCGCGTYGSFGGFGAHPVTPGATVPLAPAPSGEAIPAPKGSKMPAGDKVGTLSPYSDVTPVASPRTGLPLEGPKNPF
jgi:hypothetical protein